MENEPSWITALILLLVDLIPRLYLGLVNIQVRVQSGTQR